MRVRWHQLYHLPSMIDTLEDLTEELLRREEGEPLLDLYSFLPPVDVYETSQEIIVEMELPGMEAEELKLNASAGQLLVSGFKRDPDRGTKNYVLAERGFGRFRRLIRLPEDLECENAQALMKDGLLRVILQKKSEEKK
jgi:HSP20 family protein